MRLLRYVGKRLLILPPLVFGLLVVVFLVVRVLPGSPVGRIAGGLASEESIRTIEAQLGLDQPVHIQLLDYLQDLTRGDFGRSWFTGNKVLDDLGDRLPATLELITVSLLGMILIMVPLGVYTAVRSRGIRQKIVFWYGLLSGGLPEFWLGLVMVYVFFVILGLAPSPSGRLGYGIAPPPHVTGAYILDSLIAWDLVALRSSIAHIILPASTLILVFGGLILKMTHAVMRRALQSDYVYYARVCGLQEISVIKYAFRLSLPSLITVTGITYGYLLGGAVLVENVFTWSGVGQYAVRAALNSDYLALQGFVILAGTFSILVYLLVDIALFAADPRTEY